MDSPDRHNVLVHNSTNSQADKHTNGRVEMSVQMESDTYYRSL